MWLLIWCRWGTQPECWASVPHWRFIDNPPTDHAANTAKYDLPRKPKLNKLSREPAWRREFCNTVRLQRAYLVRISTAAQACARICIAAYGDVPGKRPDEPLYARPPPLGFAVRIKRASEESHLFAGHSYEVFPCYKEIRYVHQRLWGRCVWTSTPNPSRDSRQSLHTATTDFQSWRRQTNNRQLDHRRPACREWGGNQNRSDLC